MAYCQICGYERDDNLKERCKNCRGRKTYFGWYLLPNEILSLKIAFIIIFIAVLIVFVMFIYTRWKEYTLIVSTILPTIQAVANPFYRG